MKLYHGTSRTALDRILVDGIKPRGDTGKTNWKSTVDSNPDCVYLTEGYALHFALQAGKSLGDLAIVEVDTNRLYTSNLLPDEDAIEQSNRGKDSLPDTWNMKKRTLYYRKCLLRYAGQHHVSIKALGTCCHIGTIPVAAITRTATLDLNNNMAMRFACDPTISLINYQIMGGFYRQFTRHIFDDEIDVNDCGFPQYSDTLRILPRDGIVVTTTVNQKELT